MKSLNFAARNYYPDSPGGCEKVFYEVYKRAVKDYNVKIISSYENKNKFPKNSSIFTKRDYKNKILRYAYYALNLSVRAKRNKCDLVHANNIECIRLSKKPFVLTVHHVGHYIDPNIRKQTLFNKLMARVLVWQANRADKVITVSRKTKKDLVSMGVKEDKILVIPNGVDLNTFKPVKVRKNKKFVITHASRISPEKAQHLTINAYNNMPGNMKDKVEVRFIGYVSDKDYYNLLEKNNNFKYYTNLSEKDFVKKLNESDLVVFPTLMSEGFGLIVLEAMSCGVPVLASRQESIREAGGSVCQYFKQGDEEEYVKKIIELYKNSKLRKDLRKKGLERVKKFTWDSVYDKHKRLYKELLK